MSTHVCRFCVSNPEDFLPSYASALVFPGGTGLYDAILDTEKDLVPCFTAYCDRCRNVCLLNTTAASFPARSAHHVHQIMLMRQLQAGGVLMK